jgi:hypothetical protein
MTLESDYVLALAAWAQNQADLRKLRAEVARLEEELRQMGGGSPALEQTCSQSGERTLVFSGGRGRLASVVCILVNSFSEFP